MRRLGVSSFSTGPASSPGKERPILDVAESRRALSAFLLFGVLTSALGSFLPAWGYHLESHFATVGNYFLCLNAGLLLAVRLAFVLMPRRGIGFCLVLSSATGSVAFALLAATPPPDMPVWRGFALVLLGFSAGLLNAAAIHAISPLYDHDRAATTTLAGTLYGLGCLLTTLSIAGTYYVYSVRWVLIFFAAVPVLYIWIFLRGRFQRDVVLPAIPVRAVLHEFRNPGAVLFTLILFFQFGNEWSMAGWLPIFLIRRLGISPASSLFMLAFYWAALMIGRVAAKTVLRSIGHGKLLLGSILLALLGSLILNSTDSQSGAAAGILFIGCGFASIYPLVVEKIGHRFTYYHPGVFNGIFSFAFTGGLLAPCAVGYLAEGWGVGAIILMPALGTFLVFLLVLLIMLEAKLNGEMVARTAKA